MERTRKWVSKDPTAPCDDGIAGSCSLGASNWSKAAAFELCVRLDNACVYGCPMPAEHTDYSTVSLTIVPVVKLLHAPVVKSVVKLLDASHALSFVVPGSISSSCVMFCHTSAGEPGRGSKRPGRGSKRHGKSHLKLRG